MIPLNKVMQVLSYLKVSNRQDFYFWTNYRFDMNETIWIHYRLYQQKLFLKPNQITTAYIHILRDTYRETIFNAV